MLQGKPDNEMEVSGLKNARTLDEKQVRFHTVSTLCCMLPPFFIALSGDISVSSALHRNSLPCKHSRVLFSVPILPGASLMVLTYNGSPVYY